MTTAGAHLSVLVPSTNGLGRLRECLGALDAAAGGVRLDVVVIDRCGDHVRRAIRRDHPEVIVLAAPADTTIRHIRESGFARATAEAIGVIESHVLVQPGWARQLLDALASGGIRGAQMPLRRALQAAGAPALPRVRLLRVIARVVARRTLVARLAQFLSLLALFITAWAVGEDVGDATGLGDTLSRVA